MGFKWSKSGGSWDELERAFAKETAKVPLRTAKKIVPKVKRKAPKDSGAMAASTAALDAGESNNADLQAAQAAAKGKRPEMGFEAVDPVGSSGEAIAQIVVSADYSLYVHEGHMGRGSFVGPRPFLTNEMNNSEAILETEMSRALDKLK